MALKPTEYLKWATSDVNDPLTGAPNKRKPSSEFETEGWKRQEPVFRDHINWAFNNVGSWIEYLDTVNSTITENKTIYVATTGSDVTGDGTQFNPYATPQQALRSLIGVPIATDALVTIFCAAGKYVMSEPVRMNHPYGERINIVGDTLLGVKPLSTVIADWSSSRLAPTVPARATDEFYNSAGTLGTDADEATREAAITSDLPLNKALVESRYATVFEFVNSSGIVVDGNNSLGKIDRIALVGDWDGDFNDTDPDFNIYHGVDVSASLETTGFGTPRNVTGGTLFLGKETVIIGFRGVGIRCRYSGAVSAEDYITIVNNRWSGLDLNGFGGCVLNYCLICGNGYHGVFATNTNMFKAGGGVATGNVRNGVQISNGSSGRMRDFKSLGNGYSGVAAQINGSLSMDNAECRGNGTDGVQLTIGSVSDGDTVISSDNDRYGIYCESNATYDGFTLDIQNNGSHGVYCQNNSTAIISLSSLGVNDGDEIRADLGSFVRGSATTITSGGTITALQESFIWIPSIGGVTYSPTHGTTDANGARIDG